MRPSQRNLCKIPAVKFDNGRFQEAPDKLAKPFEYGISPQSTVNGRMKNRANTGARPSSLSRRTAPSGRRALPLAGQRQCAEAGETGEHHRPGRGFGDSNGRRKDQDLAVAGFQARKQFLIREYARQKGAAAAAAIGLTKVRTEPRAAAAAPVVPAAAAPPPRPPPPRPPPAEPSPPIGFGNDAPPKPLMVPGAPFPPGPFTPAPPPPLATKLVPAAPPNPFWPPAPPNSNPYPAPPLSPASPGPPFPSRPPPAAARRVVPRKTKLPPPPPPGAHVKVYGSLRAPIPVGMSL